MGLPPILMQGLFIYNLLKMSVPFTRHRYWVYPFIFFLVAMPSLFGILFVLFQGANDESTLVVQQKDRHYLAQLQNNTQTGTTAVRVPKSFEALCLANVTMTSLTMMALFAMMAWLVYQAERGFAVYVQPILLDIMVFEKTIWVDANDLRGVVPPEVVATA